MQASSMRVKMLSPARPVVDVDAVAVIIPTTLGYIEILPNHAPLVTEVEIGIITVKRNDGEKLHFFGSGGYVDAANNEVKVLVDVVEAATEIDRKRAESAMKRAEERLINVRDINFDLARALYARKRAEQRLKLVKESN